MSTCYDIEQPAVPVVETKFDGQCVYTIVTLPDGNVIESRIQWQPLNGMVHHSPFLMQVLTTGQELKQQVNVSETRCPECRQDWLDWQGTCDTCKYGKE